VQLLDVLLKADMALTSKFLVYLNPAQLLCCRTCVWQVLYKRYYPTQLTWSVCDS